MTEVDKRSEVRSVEPVAWIYESWIGGESWTKHVSLEEIREEKWHRNITPLYPASAQAQQQPVAWTNEAQLGYLKDLPYAHTPMAMWARRSDSSPIPLYTSSVSSAHRQGGET